MAKKTANPADAFRKAQRAKEVKKNKDNRKKIRDAQTVKKDTRSLEFEIKGLKDKKDAQSKSRLTELEAELSYINKTKEEYIKEHPEAKDRILGKPGFKGPRRSNGQQGDDEDDEDEDEEGGGKRGESSKSGLYDEQGRLRDPTRSIYFDPVYNPWGVPPPGMPYIERERSPQQDEEDSGEDSDDSDDSDEDIVMPEGPPPGEDDDSDGDSDDSDDIPLPEGPPPPKPIAPQPPAGPSAWGGRAPPVPVPLHQLQHQLPIRPPSMHMPNQPASFTHLPPLHAHTLPVRPPQHRPPGFRPNRMAPTVQDPLSDEPTQTYQGYRIDKANLPDKPVIGPSISSLPIRPPSTEAPVSATISAEPQLRDLRKETTQFVPRGVKKNASKVQAKGVGRINAAPGAGMVDEEGDERVMRREEGGGGLLGKLKGVLSSDVGFNGSGSSKGRGKQAAEDDYQDFLKGLGDLS